MGLVLSTSHEAVLKRTQGYIVPSPAFDGVMVDNQDRKAWTVRDGRRCSCQRWWRPAVKKLLGAIRGAEVYSIHFIPLIPDNPDSAASRPRHERVVLAYPLQ